MKYARDRLDQGKYAGAIEKAIDRLLGSPLKSEFKSSMKDEQARWDKAEAQYEIGMDPKEWNRILLEIYGDVKVEGGYIAHLNVAVFPISAVQ